MAMTLEHHPILSFVPDVGDIVVDLDVLVSSRMLIQANSGGGKSRALRSLLEQTHGRIPQLVFDPEGEFASLREHFPYVLISADGDVPARPDLASALCARLVELGASAILDLYELELDQRARFVQVFLDALMRLPRLLWRPLLVVIDEAHMYAPERDAGEASSKAAVISLCTRGRKRGFGVVLATQRIAKLHKDAVAELNNVLIGRTGLDIDITRAGNILGFDKERRQTLPYLAPGTFYAFGPAISREVVQVRTGPVVTTHPEPGRIAPAVPPPPEQLRTILAQLTDLAAAEPPPPDLDTALRRIAELEARLREHSVVPQIEYVEVPVLAADQLEQLDRVVQQLGATGQQLLAVAEEIGQKLAGVQPQPIQPVNQAEPPAEKPRSDGKGRLPTAGDDVRLSAPQQRILDALASFAALGLRAVARSHVAIWSGQSPTSGGYANNLGRLRSLGLIDYPASGQIALSATGADQARPAAPIRSLQQLWEAWYAWLPKPQARIVRVLIEHYPQALERGVLAEEAEQSATSGGYSNNLGALRSLGLIDYPAPGQVVATALLFPGERC